MRAIISVREKIAAVCGAVLVLTLLGIAYPALAGYRATVSGPGATGGNMIVPGQPVTFNIHMRNDAGEVIQGLDAGFTLASPNGATWAPPVYDTAGGLGEYFESVSIIEGGDSEVGLTAEAGMPGVPNGYDDIILTLTTTLTSAYPDDTLTIDTGWEPPFANWQWTTPSGTLAPEWAGALVVTTDADTIECCPHTLTPDCFKTTSTDQQLHAQQDWAWHMTSGFNQVMMTPIVADLNGDGTPEVILSGYEHFSPPDGYKRGGQVRILDGSTGASLAASNTAIDLVVAPAQLAVANLDSDPELEIVAAHQLDNSPSSCIGDGVICYDVNIVSGSWSIVPKWKRISDVALGGTTNPEVDSLWWGGPSIADVNQDGNPDIVAGNTVLTSAGQLLPTTPAGGWTETGKDLGARHYLGGPLSFAVDIDPTIAGLEVVNGRTVYQANGIVLWSLADTLGPGFAGVADFDDDTFAEVIVVWSGYVSYVDYTPGMTIDYAPGPSQNPRIEWTHDLTSSTQAEGGAPVIGNFVTTAASGGFEYPEIGVGGRTSYTVLDHNGAQVRQWTIDDASSMRTSSAAFDFDADGQLEIVCMDQGHLRVYDATTQTIRMSFPNTSATDYENPVIADVDGDQTAEIVLCANWGASHAGIRVFEEPNNKWARTRPIWNQHAYSITHITDGGTVTTAPGDGNNWDPLRGLNNFRAQTSIGADTVYLPDLCVNKIVSDCDNNGNTVIKAYVVNNGPVAITSPIEVAFYETAGLCPPPPGNLIGTVFIPPVLGPFPAGVWVQLTVPNYVQYVEVCADDDGTQYGIGPGVIEECDEFNNCCCGELPDRECKATICGRVFYDNDLSRSWDIAVDAGVPVGTPMMAVPYNGLIPLASPPILFTNTGLDGYYCFPQISGWQSVTMTHYRISETSVRQTPEFYSFPTPDYYYDWNAFTSGTFSGHDFGIGDPDSIDCWQPVCYAPTIVAFQNQSSVQASFSYLQSQSPINPLCNTYTWWVAENNPSPVGLTFSPDHGTALTGNTISFNVIDPSGLTLGVYYPFVVYVVNDCYKPYVCLPGEVTLSPDWAVSADSSSTKSTVASAQTVNFTVRNLGPTGPFDYRVVAQLECDGSPDEYVSLNGLAPGVDLEGSVAVAEGDSTTLAIPFSFTEPRPGEIHKLLLMWDCDNNGSLDPGMTADIVYTSGLCCVGQVGDANGIGGDLPTIGDVSTMIDMLFISGDPEIIACPAEADINQSGGADPQISDITIGDVSTLIDYLFITGPSLGLAECL